MFQVKSPPSKNRNGPSSSSKTMLLALSEGSGGFSMILLHAGLGSFEADASMKRCLAARQRRVSFDEPPEIGIRSPGAITWRLPAFISRYGLLICSQRSVL